MVCPLEVEWLVDRVVGWIKGFGGGEELRQDACYLRGCFFVALRCGVAYGRGDAWGDVFVSASEGSGKDGREAGEVTQVRVDFVLETLLDVTKDANPGIMVHDLVRLIWRYSRPGIVLVGQQEGNIVLDDLRPWSRSGST